MEQYTDTNDQLMKSQSKIKEFTRDVRNKEVDIDDQRKTIDPLNQEKRKEEKVINELQDPQDEARSESGKEHRLRERAEQDLEAASSNLVELNQEISKVSDEKDAPGYPQALATKMTEELDDATRPRWRNRQSAKLDKLELLNLQSQLQSELQAKHQISEELSRTKDELTTTENTLQESYRQMQELKNTITQLEQEVKNLNDKKLDEWEREGKNTSILKSLNERYSLLPDQMSNDSEKEDDSEADNTSGTDSRTDSRSDLRTGSDLDLSLSHEVQPFTQPYEPVRVVGKAGSPGQYRSSSSPAGANIPHSPKSPHAKSTHRFIIMSFQSLYKCNFCTSLLVGVQRQGITCEVCGYTYHVWCMEKCPQQCPVPPELTKHPLGIDVSKGQGTAYEGFVRIPKLGGIKKGWTREYMVVCDFKLLLYEIPSDKNWPTQPVQPVLDMRDEVFSAAAVLPSDLIHANKKDIPCIFRVTTSMLNPPGSQHQILLLAENEKEKDNWLTILNLLHKMLRSKHLPNKSVYNAQEVCDNSLSLVKGTHCAAILDSSRLVLGTDDGLYVVELSKDQIIRIGDRSERKQVYQIELVLEQQIGVVVYISGKQRHIKLLNVSALEGYESDPIMIKETKGCHIFCRGEIRQPHGGNSCCVCMGIKCTVQVYEVNRTRQKYRKMKDIQVPGQVECVEMMSDRLCVGYPSCFAIYRVQGDAAPMNPAALCCGGNKNYLCHQYQRENGEFLKCGTIYISSLSLSAGTVFFPDQQKKCTFCWRNSQYLMGKLMPERRSGEISGPLSFSHIAHVGPGQRMPSSQNPPPVPPERRSGEISGPLSFSHIAHVGPGQRMPSSQNPPPVPCLHKTVLLDNAGDLFE